MLRAELSEDCAALVIQQPNFYGNFEDALAARDASTASGSLLIACVDPISLGVTAPPGEYDADIAVAEGQSLGCPMGFGGPLLGLFACKERFMRRLPGRIVGQTLDASNKRAFVMTLRTREQDIRRERATSNICTNEALYALAATVYLATMGPKGMEQVGHLCLQKARYAAEQIGNVDGFNLVFPSKWTFKEFLVSVPGEAIKLSEFLLLRGVLGGFVTAALVPEFGETMLFCVTENRTRSEIDLLVALLAEYSAEVSRDGGLPQ